ncbi:hypothetical protein WJX74_001177 [Apatococcus lobatus]|uniref:Uncharacterized protein n=1 Tax=Apatococcus lobatus TaxID=904363 RepID=A0AAW1QMK1_9CHLO
MVSFAPVLDAGTIQREEDFVLPELEDLLTAEFAKESQAAGIVSGAWPFPSAWLYQTASTSLRPIKTTSKVNNSPALHSSLGAAASSVSSNPGAASRHDSTQSRVSGSASLPLAFPARTSRTPGTALRTNRASAGLEPPALLQDVRGTAELPHKRQRVAESHQLAESTTQGQAQAELDKAEGCIREQELEIQELQAKIRGLQSGQQELEIQQLRANLAVLQSTQPADNSHQDQALQGGVRAQRTNPLNSLSRTDQDLRMARLVNGLAQPNSSPGNTLATILELNTLRGVTYTAVESLRAHHLEGLVIQPGWMEYSLSPDGGGVLKTLQAFRRGLEDTPLAMSITGRQGTTPLRMLTQIPLQQWPAIVGRMIRQACDARTFSHQPHDVFARKAVQISSEMCILAYGIMTFSEAHSEVFASMQGSVLGQGPADIPPRIELAAARLNLSKYQIRLCKEIWRECCMEMAQAQAERRQIFETLQSSSIEEFIRDGALHQQSGSSYSQCLKLLEAAAELAANSALQTEIVMHSRRRFNLQVCTPEMITSLSCDSAPYFVCRSMVLEHFAIKC